MAPNIRKPSSRPGSTLGRKPAKRREKGSTKRGVGSTRSTPRPAVYDRERTSEFDPRSGPRAAPSTGPRPAAGPRLGAGARAPVDPPAHPAPIERPLPPPPPEIRWEELAWEAARAHPDDDFASKEPRPFRCGQVTLAGQPNVGKSTLMNRVIGEKLAIVSPKPQTTRDRIAGYWTGPDTQIVFLDTPGIHKARSPLNRAMVGVAIESLETVDVVVLVVDAQNAVRWADKIAKQKGPSAPLRQTPAVADEGNEPEDFGEDEGGEEAKETEAPLLFDPRVAPGERRVIRSILRYNKKWMVALNKVDVTRHMALLPVIQAYSGLPHVGPIVPISARTADGIAPLVEAIRTYLPEQPAEFSADEFTDRSVRFLCAEFLREQVFLQTREEVPYGVAVEIEKFEDLADLTHVQAVVHVEKPAQRAILIGKAGARMKELATAARAQMEELLGRKVFLEVHVRIEPKWSERIEMLKQFGYIL